MALDEDDPTIEDEGWEDQLTQLLRRIRLNVRFRRGRSLFDEVVYGAKRALLSGEFRTGQFFPSVRDLAKELKIHRNTAHQIVKYLAENDWLETCPRCLTTITKVRGARAGKRLTQRVDQLFWQAQRLGWDLAEVVHAVEQRGRTGNGLKRGRGLSKPRRGGSQFGNDESQVTEIKRDPAYSVLPNNAGL